MLNTLRARIVALVILFCVLVSAIFVAVLNSAYMGYYDELRQRQGIEFARNVAQMYPELGRFASLDRAEVEATFEKMLLLDPRSAIYLLDPSGRVMAGYTKERSIGSKSSVSLVPINRLLAAPADSSGSTVFGDDPDFADRKNLFAAAPFLGNDGQRVLGYVYVLMRPPDIDVSKTLMSSYANRSAVAVAVGGALASALLIFAVLFLITRPLRRLTDAADAVSENTGEEPTSADGLSLDVYESRNDEIGRLARAFRAMVMRLRVQVQRVRRMDNTRREWIANVSHDLRTPLTSLIGHLEMVQLRGERLSDAERARFLDVAMRNAQHIDRLSSSLFDLARLDSDDLPLDKSPAHLGELLDDLVTRFVPVAQARGVEIKVEYASGLPLIAIDAALVERAVVNLIDNALRYTPDGGNIVLRAAAEQGTVLLTVSDSGSGIAADAIEHVFERFYQASQHREGRGHAGLGLALVHRVAELHGGSATAGNREGGGAVFTLRFPAN